MEEKTTELKEEQLEKVVGGTTDITYPFPEHLISPKCPIHPDSTVMTSSKLKELVISYHFKCTECSFKATYNYPRLSPSDIPIKP